MSHLDSLSTYDESFELINETHEIDNRTFRANDLSTDHTGQYIFIVDSKRNKILKIDLELNFVDEYGSEGHGKHQFNYPHSLACHDQSLYICDMYNKRIQVASTDFAYENTFKLDYSPWYIQIVQDIIYLKEFNLPVVYFYDLKNFKLKFRHDLTTPCHLGSFNSFVFEYQMASGQIACFDPDGSLIKQFTLQLNNATSGKCGDGKILRFAKRMLISSHWNHKIIVV